MTTKKKKIGLALGSGASRGWAHIGVLRTLESWGIVPDIIAGCSIGALVGGVFASGKLQDLESWSSSLTRSQVRSFFDLAFDRRGGPVKGERLIHLLKKLGFEQKIEEMPIAFCAIATDLQRGTKVILREGSFMSALRASGSIPGFLTPVQLDGKWLVDGGVVDPVPIAACREMGADFVIAVNLNAGVLQANDWCAPRRYASLLSGLYEKSKAYIPSSCLSAFDPLFDVTGAKPNSRAPRYFEVLYSMTAIMQEQILNLRLEIEPPDIEIKPTLSHLHLFDFHRAGEAIEEGHRAMRHEKKGLLNKIEKLRKSEKEN